MWLALPSPSGNPTTRWVPTSRMISSAIASGSENSFGITYKPRRNGNSRRLESNAAARQHNAFVTDIACDEPATAKHRIRGFVVCDGLPVAAAPSKQVEESGSSAEADGRGYFGIT